MPRKLRSCELSLDDKRRSASCQSRQTHSSPSPRRAAFRVSTITTDFLNLYRDETANVEVLYPSGAPNFV